MKKIILTLFAVVFALAMPLATVNVNTAKAEDFEGVTLRVYNWEDYVGEGVIEDFEAETGINVEYGTFGTCEDMYNNLKINPKDYDLICPSEYMIQKLAVEGKLKKLDETKLDVYNQTSSPYIRDVFNTIKWQDDGETVTLSDYATCYMWGTLGLVYNPETVSAFDMESWTSLWINYYQNKLTIKDSIRDSYFLGLAAVYKDELLLKADEYESGAITFEEYQTALAEIFNRTDDATIKLVEKRLNKLKENIYGFEVDSGKNDIVSGKISINFAWSGDAVFAMDEAEADDVYLNYSVPKEGSNIWFDGWCVPKDVSDSKMDAVYAFLNYMSRPSVAIKNMEYIGYTCSITGSMDEGAEVASQFDFIEDGTVVSIKDWLISYYGLETTATEDCPYEVDLTYLFGEDMVVYTDVIGRQFSAQYPDYDTVSRCAVMQYFDDETNANLSAMWERVKGFSLPTWAIVLIVVGVVLVIGVIVLIIVLKKKGVLGGKGKKSRPSKKGVKVVNKENV